MKKLLAILLIAAVVLPFAACGKVPVEKERHDTSMFVTVERANIWDVVYHKDTLVMYVVSNGMYNSGTFTVMVDQDGAPLLWKGGGE